MDLFNFSVNVSGFKRISIIKYKKNINAKKNHRQLQILIKIHLLKSEIIKFYKDLQILCRFPNRIKNKNNTF